MVFISSVGLHLREPSGNGELFRIDRRRRKLSQLCRRFHEHSRGWSLLRRVGVVFSGRRGRLCFLCPNPPNPPIPKPPSLLAIAEDADCCATSPAEGGGGADGVGGRGASLAAGRGSPFAVAPMRITCSTGIPFNFDISLTICDIPWEAAGCIAAREDDKLLALNISPILAPISCRNPESLHSPESRDHPHIIGDCERTLLAVGCIGSDHLHGQDRFRPRSSPLTCLVVPVLRTLTLNLTARCLGGLWLGGGGAVGCSACFSFICCIAC